MDRNVILIAGRCAAALALLFLAGCAPITAGGAVAASATTIVQPVGTAVPAPTIQPLGTPRFLGTAIPAPTEVISSTDVPTSTAGVIVGTSVPSTITLDSITPTATQAAGGQVGTPTSESPTVTLADQGKTITLAVGQRFLLSLGEGYNWNVSIDNQNMVSRVIGILTVRGSQGLYEAHLPGTATLTATGDPLCRQSKPPCERPSILFNVKIVVQ
jgi:hypothetical protein